MSERSMADDAFAPRLAASLGVRVRPATSRPEPVPTSVYDLPDLAALDDPELYLSTHSKSFRFAASTMPRSGRTRIARVYAWCRYTDNLVDDDAPLPVAERRLEAWLGCAREAYEGRDCGVPLVNRVMGEMADAGVPFAYPLDLVRAMSSDLHFTPFPDLDALRVYTYRAAGVVGRWLTELHGVRDPWMLERATALGQAMQLTNILRDVGEDLGRGRLYLPTDVLIRHRLSARDLDAIACGAGDVDERYVALTEELMSAADDDYARAREALPYLPTEFRRAATIACAVYQGIHDAIRRNRYDNVRVRAYTTGSRKIGLAARALVSLAFARMTPAPARASR